VAIDLSDQDIAPETRPSGRLTVGMRLRAAREAAELDVAEVALRTKIPQRHLAALEADAHDRLPAATFSLGFVRSMAREVGLDPEELAAQFRAEFTRAPMPAPSIAFEPIEPERTPSRWLAWVSGGLVAAALIAAFFLGRGDDASTEPEVAPDVAVTVAPAAPDTAVTPEMEAAALASQPVTLTAREEAWIQVRDRQSGTTIMEGILARGQSYSVPSGDLVLRTGRAGALAIKVGSRDIPPLGGPVEIVSNVSLQPAALLARAAGPVLPALPPPPGSGVVVTPTAPAATGAAPGAR
jgi:cytoskeleton protein RodZ